MSTGINIAPSSDLTVGTTAVTSGTDTRVFFQAGGVVQQDANFTFDNTLKRLTLKAVGTAATDIPFVVRNSTDTFDILSCFGNETTIIGRNASNEPRLIINRAGTTKMTLGGTTDLNIQFPNSGYGQLNSGTQGWDIISTSGDIRTRNSSISTILKGNFFGVGIANPAARLDVQAQGALSTDIAFRVRNSADTVTLQEYRGDGSWLHRNNANTFYEYFDGTSRIEYRRVGSVELGTNNDVTQFRFMCNVGDVAIRGGTNLLNIVNNNNFHFEESTGILPTSGAGCIVMKNRTAPSTNVQDRFYLYSADIVAGNAAPHFRTENGSIIKLYQQSSAGIATVGDLVTVLQNLGLLS